jgi:hypothetical protein
MMQQSGVVLIQPEQLVLGGGWNNVGAGQKKEKGVSTYIM